jgi:ABC-type nitrate/sulfonate/bicarbonate transport system ATPase subunit
LHDIDLSTKNSEVVALVGASGCGKSTLLGSSASYANRPNASTEYACVAFYYVSDAP